MPALTPDTIETDIAAALAEGGAAALFAGLPPSHKGEYLRWIDEAKKPETRRKRIVGMVTRLKDGQQN